MLKKITNPFIFLLSFVLIGGCNDEIEINSEGDDILIVYAIFNLKDTIQYIRIGKSFQNGKNGDVSAIAKRPDSISPNPDQIRVELEVYHGEELVEGPSILEFVPNSPKEEGYFANNPNLVYAYTHQLNPNHHYKIIVTNLLNKQVAYAESDLLGNRDFTYAFEDMRRLHIQLYQPEDIDYEGYLDFLSNYRERVMRFHYYDIKDDVWTMKYIDWLPYHDITIGGYKTDTSDLQYSDEYLGYLAEHIPVKPGVKRKAIGLDYMLTIAGDEFKYYLMNCNNPNVFHYMSFFSNIENGLGIFSSRYYYTFFAEGLTDETIDTLAYGRFTMQLNFMDHEGN